MTMTRQEAIERIESKLSQVHMMNYVMMSDEDYSAIQTLLSTAKQVEEVVGKLENDIKNLKKHLDLDEVAYIVELRMLEYILSLLTEDK